MVLSYEAEKKIYKKIVWIKNAIAKKQKSHNTHTHIWMIYTRGKVAPECEKSQRCKWNARNELVKKHFSILILPVGWVVCCCRHRHRFWLAQFFFFPSWTRTNKVIYISFRILWCLVVFISFYTIFFRVPVYFLCPMLVTSPLLLCIFSTSLDISFKSFKNLRLQQIWTHIVSSALSLWWTLLFVRCIYSDFPLTYFIWVDQK